MDDMTLRPAAETPAAEAKLDPPAPLPAEAAAPEAGPAAPGGEKAPAPALSSASRALPKKPAAPKAPAKPTTATVVDVRFKSGGKAYSFDPGKLVIPSGAHVIIDTARGPEYGICTAGNHTVPLESVVQPLRPVLRVATLQDEKNLEENKAKEGQAFEICNQKILDHGLEMKLVSVEYAFDGSKILFFFTADGRVDFRELVKDLASVFRTRIELRQIGVRDEAKLLGGLGICGRPFCCAQFLDDFQPVSIKMAKTQSLSLNPTKISGTCGRLMCCLKYEQEAYEDLIKSSPKAESFVDTPAGRGTVTDVNVLRQRVTVRIEDDPSTTKCFNNCDICVLRNGKAKKNDPPIPKDLAPISSAPHPVQQEPADDNFLLPEPVLISYFAEGEQERCPAQSGTGDRTSRSRSQSGNGSVSQRRRSQSRSSQPRQTEDRRERTGSGTAAQSGGSDQKSGARKKRNYNNNHRNNAHRRSRQGGTGSAGGQSGGDA